MPKILDIDISNFQAIKYIYKLKSPKYIAKM